MGNIWNPCANSLNLSKIYAIRVHGNGSNQGRRDAVKCTSAIFSIGCYLVLSLIAFPAHSEVASCQTDDQGTITSCMEFASGKSIPGPLEKICSMGSTKNVKWFKNPCPRTGTIGYCEVPRNDTITQVVYCYKKQGIPDKQKLGFCKQACKGRFAAY